MRAYGADQRPVVRSGRLTRVGAMGVTERVGVRSVSDIYRVRRGERGREEM